MIEGRLVIVGDAQVQETPLGLLRGYGFDPAVLTMRQFLEYSGPCAHVLTWDPSCVPVLATLEEAWSPRRLGALASFGADLDTKEHLKASGLAGDGLPDLHVLAGVQNGVSRVYWSQQNAPLRDCIEPHLDRVCEDLAIKDCFFHLAMTQTDMGIVALSPFCADPALIAAARADGVCPVWISVCYAAGQTPFVPHRQVEPQSNLVSFA